MMQQFNQFHFIRPVVLLLLPVAVWIWFVWRRQADPLRGWREQIEPSLLAALVVGRKSGSNLTPCFILSSWVVAIIAVAGPTWQLEPSPFADDVSPLMILLKADISMDSSDPAPSRLERARLKIADIAEARKGLPLGLMAYAGSAHLVLPPTRDTDVVAQMAAEISPEIMPMPGDQLDKALLKAKKVLMDGGQGGSIVVLADSVDVDSEALKSVADELKIPVQFLSVNAPESSQRDSVQAAARLLGGTVELLDVENRDVAAIVSKAASAPVAREGSEGERWQEAGYWLVPFVAVLFLSTFRREEQQGES